ncbi:ABC transporter, permease component [Chitinispirillum alkaliphilum]|nr:ABC transporter, permease component [Chitinispirillum alkaliphilum]
MKDSKTDKFIEAPPFLDRTWIESSPLIQGRHDVKTIIDLSKTEKIDSAGICFIKLLQKMHSDANGKLVLRNVSPQILREFTSRDSKEKAPEKKRGGFFLSVGNSTVKGISSAVQALSVLVEMLYWGSIGLIYRKDFKKGGFGEQMYQLGFRAFLIVTLLSFLVGVVLALQTAIQLKVYGAGVFLAPVIGITMVRELGPLLTAVILSGRTGSATTAEIATMSVGEELDALQTMGINPVQFVVVPKFWAISITMPLLSGLATAAGILGGFFVALMYLDITPALYWSELIKHLHFRDVFAGFFKSLVFSWLIVWTGAYYGLRVKGGAEAVGKETTSSVVTGIFIIIVVNAIFSFFL